jgi:isopenicillin N synthase-like dioxygenase
MELPTLDFSKFLRGSELERIELSNALVDSFRDHGFVKIINHGVPEGTVQNFLESV